MHLFSHITGHLYELIVKKMNANLEFLLISCILAISHSHISIKFERFFFRQLILIFCLARINDIFCCKTCFVLNVSFVKQFSREKNTDQIRNQFRYFIITIKKIISNFILAYISRILYIDFIFER